jgi:transposase
MRVRGEKHHNAKLSDHDVSLIRQLSEQHGLNYRQLAEKFDSKISTVRDIVKYYTR